MISASMNSPSATPIHIDPWNRFALIAAMVGTALSIMAVWLPSYLPTQDGAPHLYMATALRWIAEDPSSIFATYFQSNRGHQPNLFIFAALAGLLEIFDPAVAEKILASLYLVALPLSAMFTARMARGNSGLAALLVLPVGLSFTFMMGFYNYSFSAVVFVFGLGIWLWCEKAPGFARFSALMLVAVAAFFCHIFGAAALLLVAGTGTAWRLAVGVSQDRPANMGTRLVAIVQAWIRRGWPLALAFAPTLLLILEFASTRSGVSGGVDHLWFERIIMLAGFSFVSALDRLDAVFAAGYAIIVALAGYFMFRQRAQLPIPAAMLGFSTISFIALFLLMPMQMSGSSYVIERLLPFIYLTGVLAFALTPVARRFSTMAIVALAVLGSVLPITRGYQFHSIDQRLSPLHDLDTRLKSGHTLLAVRIDSFDRPDFKWRMAYRIDPVVHASMRLATTARLVDLKVSQANGLEAPMTYRQGRNPFWHLPANLPQSPDKMFWRHLNYRLGDPAPDLDFAGYEAKTGGRVDYLILWGPFDEVQSDPKVIRFMARIKERFQLDHVASPLFRLYKHRGISDE